MSRLFTIAGICLLCVHDAQATAFNPSKVVIIKADDFKVPNQAWTNFLASSRGLGVKVGLGVVVTNIVGNTTTAQWMQTQQAVGDVEFWNHGWDHSRWTVGSSTLYEFKGSGAAFQQTHFSDAQAGLFITLGRNAMAFGPPYNQYDTDTVAIMNNTPALRLFFTHRMSTARSAGLLDRVATVGIISESGGTGKPIASSFIAAYPVGPAGPVSLQFHPTDFTAADLGEYEQILQFMLNMGYTFSDTSGNGRNGTFTSIGTGTYTYTANSPTALHPQQNQSLKLFQSGTVGGARLLCGLNGTSIINFKTADWTVAGWVNRANTTDQDIVFHLGSNLGNSNTTTPTPDFTLTFNSGANTLSLKNYSSASLTSTPDVNITTTVPSGEWHHFAVVRNGGLLTLYMDGVSVGSDNLFSLDINPTDTNVAKFGAGAGASVGTTARYFNGSMADLAIFNAPLPHADLVKLHAAPVSYLGGLSATNTVSVSVGNLIAWRQFHFETTANIGIAADAEDPDGDGVSNFDEYILGTVPTSPDAGSPLQISPDAALTLTFFARQTGGIGYDGLTRHYAVESTTDLANAASWTNLPGYANIVATDQNITLTPTSNGNRCFYRLRVWLE
jgi:hypothetical protein